MVTLDEAKAIVGQFLHSRQEAYVSGEELDFDDSDITEFNSVWVFSYTTWNYKDALNESARPMLKPIMVSKEDGGIHMHLGPAHVLRMAGSFDYNNAFLEIRRVLEGYPFRRQQGGVCFGGQAATVMVAAVDLTTRPPRFAASVRDSRMLRIEELNDLLPVVQRVAGLAGDGS